MGIPIYTISHFHFYPNTPTDFHLLNQAYFTPLSNPLISSVYSIIFLNYPTSPTNQTSIKWASYQALSSLYKYLSITHNLHSFVSSHFLTSGKEHQLELLCFIWRNFSRDDEYQYSREIDSIIVEKLWISLSYPNKGEGLPHNTKFC